MLIVLPALAADSLAWDCPALQAPADGLPYAVPGELSDAVHDTIAAWIEAQYDETCPGACGHLSASWRDDLDTSCSYTTDCVTATGTHIVESYASNDPKEWTSLCATESWQATIETSAGTLTWTTESSDCFKYWAGWEEQGRSWQGAWSGLALEGLPETGDIRVDLERSREQNDDVVDGEESETTVTDTCTWVTHRQCDRSFLWAVDDTTYDLALGEKALHVHPYGCSGSVATLDGLDQLVDPTLWTPLPDADGDMASGADDCDDSDPTLNVCEWDASCDDVDQDCDGVSPTDADGDGWIATCEGGRDCDDGDRQVHPNREDPIGDGLDLDCNGYDGVLVPDPEPEGCRGAFVAFFLPFALRRR